MSFSLLLIGLSLALLAYWFRYSCLLILRTQAVEDYAAQVSRANGLTFDLVKRQLEAQSASLDDIYLSLERDYRIVSSLMQQISGNGGEDNAFEIKLLSANFRVSQAWYRVSRGLGLKTSVNALEEMADTISHFANSFGQTSACGMSA